MAQGKVTINNLNLSQGATPEIERKALFIGLTDGGVIVPPMAKRDDGLDDESDASTQQSSGVNARAMAMPSGNPVIAIDAQTNLDDVLGDEPSVLRNNVEAARLNGGENWTCFAAYAGGVADWRRVVDQAMAYISVEFIVLCSPDFTQSPSDIVDMQACAEELRTGYGRRVIFLAASSGVASREYHEWQLYMETQADLVRDVVADRVAVVPLLHGVDVGVLAGRLCNRAVSIADSPMRVATGAVLGISESPVDDEGVPLSNAMLAQLDSYRLSCMQRYPDYPGVYWGDCNLLSAPGSDYQVVEHLRPVDKAARAVRLLAIARIANRSLNQTPVSIAANKTYFMRPLREMSQSVVFNGEHFPGDIQPPKDDAVTIVWPSPNKVEIYLKLQPYNSPKEIEANIILDLSQEN